MVTADDTLARAAGHACEDTTQTPSAALPRQTGGRVAVQSLTSSPRSRQGGPPPSHAHICVGRITNVPFGGVAQARVDEVAPRSASSAIGHAGAVMTNQ